MDIGNAFKAVCGFEWVYHSRPRRCTNSMRIHKKRRRQSAAPGHQQQRPHPHLTFCVLCGCQCAPTECRHVDAAVAQRAVASRCAPTAFHYAAVMALLPTDRRAMCLSCVNWRRQPRGARGIRREKLRSYTPLDSIILFALAPGYFPEPDHRCFGRLARVAADPSNAFASSIPEQVRSVLASVAGLHPEAMASTLISSWWELNGHTSFFRHPETARVVRHTRSLAEAGGDHRGGEAAHAVRRRWRR